MSPPPQKHDQITPLVLTCIRNDRLFYINILYFIYLCVILCLSLMTIVILSCTIMTTSLFTIPTFKDNELFRHIISTPYFFYIIYFIVTKTYRIMFRRWIHIVYFLLTNHNWQYCMAIDIGDITKYDLYKGSQ